MSEDKKLEQIKQIIEDGEIKLEPATILSYGYATQLPKKVDKIKSKEEDK